MCAALLPAALLMRFIYRKDKVEKEPAKILCGLILRGCLAGVIAIIMETAGEFLLETGVSEGTPAYNYLLSFCVVAMAEEGAKLFLMKRFTWYDPAFNYRFDGIVYAAFISLGFAAFENIGYVATYGLTVSISRAFLSIPGHLGFSVFMGLYYSRAKKAENHGDIVSKRRNLALSFIVPVLLHGFYDACCLSGQWFSTILFLLFVAAMYVIVIRLINKESRCDEPLRGSLL